MRVELHGLAIETEIPFAGRWASGDASPDITVEISSSGFPEPGEQVATFERGAARYHLERGPNHYVFRFPELAEFRLSHTDRVTRVEVAAASGADPELVSLVLSGNVLALAMILRDLTVLHASAVLLDPELVVAFMGASGMGKSTLAGLLCASGASLVADDVLRVDTDTGVARYFPGSPELRLRPNANWLADFVPAKQRRDTCDGRLAVSPTRTSDHEGLLQAIIVPQLGAAEDETRLRRLSSTEATMELLKYPRLSGWHHPEWLAWHLRHAAVLARSVPMFEAFLPRFDAFSEERAARIAETLRRELIVK